MYAVGVRRISAVWVGVVVLAMVLMAAGPVVAQDDGLAQEPAPLINDTTCFGLEGSPTLTELQEAREVTCYELEVPLFHDLPEEGTAQLAVAVLNAVGEPTGPPILKLTGGPGEAAIRFGLTLFGLAAPVTLGPEGLSRDVILLDQRGTGYSQPNLDCPEVGAGVMQGSSAVPPTAEDAQSFLQSNGPTAFAQAVAACRARLVADVDLNAFTTDANARDLELLRVALDQDQLALYGTSYGTKLALRAMDLFGDSWTSVVLSSPIPGDANFMAEIAETYDQALTNVDAACEADPRCTFTDVVQRASARIVALAEDTSTVTVPNPADGSALTATLTANGVASSLYQLHYLEAAPIPAVLDGLADGEDRGFAFALGTRADALPLSALTGPTPSPDGPLPAAFGMQLSNICAEEYTYFDTEAYVEALGRVSPLAAAFGAAPFSGAISPAVCEIWDVAPAPGFTYETVSSDIPTLIVTGEFDHITPEAYGPRTADTLSAATVLNVPDGIHAPLLGLGECGGAILSGFIDSDTDTLDTSCATSRTPVFDALLPDAPTLGAERVAGPNRYATAAATSRFTYPQGAPVVIVASGEDFADALTGGAAGGSVGAPLLLTGQSSLPPETAEELARLQPEQVVVIGGTAAVEESLLEAIRQASAAPVERIAGADRFETAALAAEAFFPESDGAWLTTGNDFPDALTAGAAAGSINQPVLLVNEGLPEATEVYLGQRPLESVTIVGGPLAVSDETAALAVAAAGTAEAVRIGGNNRFETAAAVAAATPATASRIAVVAVAGDSFADALSATPLAAGRAPLILLGQDGPADIVRQVVAERIGSAIAVGGTAALPDSAVVDLAGALPPLFPVAAPAR